LTSRSRTSIPAFKTGASLALIPRKYFTVVTMLLDYLCERRVTTLIWATSALCLVAQFKRPRRTESPRFVNKVLFSGELMPVKYLQQWQRGAAGGAVRQPVRPDGDHVQLHLLYGIARAFGPEEQLPIGRAFPNEKVFLLDEHGREVTETGLPSASSACPARRWRSAIT
jgi:non-ribosomal peptide synthetase component F